MALREILHYHVGFEAIADATEQSVRYSPFETLLLDQNASSALDGFSEVPVSDKIRYSHFTVPGIQGRGAISANIMLAAEHMLQAQMKGENSVHPLSLSPHAIRALYALQLEMDTLLPLKVSALCRIWAEERLKVRKEGGEQWLGHVPPVLSSTNSSGQETSVR